jgi:Uma2 family endonuclease
MSTAQVLTPPPKVVPKDPYDHDHYEVVDGVRVELPPMSTESTGIATLLTLALGSYGLSRNVGLPYTEMLIKLPLNRDRSRKPDVIFVPFTTWPRGQRLPDTAAWDVLPNLCVEVVSPTDRASDLTTKVEEYLEAGVRQVWVVYPRTAVVHVFEVGGAMRRLTRADTLDGGTVLPGLSVPLADLLWEPTPAASESDE